MWSFATDLRIDLHHLLGKAFESISLFEVSARCLLQSLIICVPWHVVAVVASHCDQELLLVVMFLLLLVACKIRSKISNMTRKVSNFVEWSCHYLWDNGCLCAVCFVLTVCGLEICSNGSAGQRRSDVPAGHSRTVACCDWAKLAPVATGIKKELPMSWWIWFLELKHIKWTVSIWPTLQWISGYESLSVCD